MRPELQKRVQRYGWDKASKYYENCWRQQLKPAHDALLKIAHAKAGESVIDIAAGTGLISFPLANTVGLNGKIIATDISDEMVTIGNETVKSNEIQNIQFERMDAEAINYNENTFNLAICALGLMYFPDPYASLSEIYRVLKPGGRVVTAVWGSRKKCGWSDIFPIVDARVKTDVCPMFFNLGENDTLKYPFENAGFKNISIQRIETKLIYSNAVEACDASFLGGPVAMAYSRFDETSKIEARAEYIKSIEPFKTKNGYDIPGEFVIGSAIKE